MWHHLSVNPLATVSAIGFYAILLALAFPEIRERAMPLPKRTVGAQHLHLEGLDAYRGFASLLVALGHMWWFASPLFQASQGAFPPMARGAAAVPVFCVLSGFLISRSALAIRTAEDLRAYAIRRVFRIWPVYAVGVLLCAAMGLYGATALPMRAFFADLFMFRVLWWPGYANPVAWSLYHELLFYALMPLIAVVAGRRHLALFALLAIVAFVLADHPERNFGIWRFFMIGVLASELTSRLPVRWATATFVSGLIVGIFYMLMPQRMADVTSLVGLTVPRDDDAGLLLGLGCFLVLVATPHLPAVGRFLEAYPLRLFGMVSYSLYVTHLFFLQANYPDWRVLTQNLEFFGQFEPMPFWYLPVVFLPGMLFWAIVCYVAVERPGIALGKRLARREPVWPRGLGGNRQPGDNPA